MSPCGRYRIGITVAAMSRLLSLLPIVAVLAVIAGCGGGSSNASSSGATASSTTQPSSGGQGHVVRLSADPSGQLRFTQSTLTVAKPGKVTLSMKNPSSAGMDHAIAIEGNGVDSDGPTVGPGSTSTVTVTLKKGTYTYYCPVPGHKQAGMMGTLTVR
jgi:plastocyanin